MPLAEVDAIAASEMGAQRKRLAPIGARRKAMTNSPKPSGRRTLCDDDIA
jgi:hypothetical protein